MRKRNLGFTLLELLVVIVIIGLLAGYVAPKYFSQVGKSETQVARAQIDSLEKALDQYRLEKRRYPSAEEGLAALAAVPAEGGAERSLGPAVRVPRRRQRRLRAVHLRARRQGRRQRGRCRRRPGAIAVRSFTQQVSKAAMQFNVLALDARQQVVALTLEAASDDARRRPGARQRAERGLASKQTGFRLGLPRRSVRFPATLFSVELVSLLDAGLNLVEALQTLAEKEAARRAPARCCPRSSPRSTAASRSRRPSPALPRHFSPLYVATIKAAERTGNVTRGARPLHRLPGRDRARDEEDRLGQHLPGDPDGRRRAWCWRSSCSTWCRASPGSTRTWPARCRSSPSCCSTFGNFVGNNVVVLGLAFAGLIGGAFVCGCRVRTCARGSTCRSGACRRSAARMKVYQLARLYRTSAMLLRAGIPAVRALDMVQRPAGGASAACNFKARTLD